MAVGAVVADRGGADGVRVWAFDLFAAAVGVGAVARRGRVGSRCRRDRLLHGGSLGDDGPRRGPRSDGGAALGGRAGLGGCALEGESARSTSRARPERTSAAGGGSAGSAGRRDTGR